MDNEIYRKLSELLNELPNGYPATESGVEIDILKKIFAPDDIELFFDLKIKFETPEQISERTGRPLEGLEKKLTHMRQKGQIASTNINGRTVFKMVPWAVGIYELQRPHMDRELAKMCNEYMKVWSDNFFRKKPQLMQVVPIETEINGRQLALPYAQVSNIIERSKSFAVTDCICKKEKHLLEKGCNKPVEICTIYSPLPSAFDNSPVHRAITKKEAYKILNIAEEAGLVHLTWNVATGHYFICNCCGCCCHALSAINELGIKASEAINSYYYAEIDSAKCNACNVCSDERCQVGAISKGEEYNQIIRERCIGCGLCITSCPTRAIKLFRKEDQAIFPPPENEMEWYQKRAKEVGVDIRKVI